MDSSQYVVGFMFRRDGSEVALIRKNKPDWQRGKLNGVGGKVEADETSRGAMVREFKEETGCDTERSDWRFFLTLIYPKATISFFECRASDGVELKTTTDEVVEWHGLPHVLLSSDIIPNLRWLIPLALDETRLAGVMNG